MRSMSGRSAFIITAFIVGRMSYQVIARKYRPQIFDDVVGQRLITDTLKNAVLHNRVAHGYIFSGARGVGKTTTARILAKALNCVQGPTVTPCGVCDSCREIAAGNSVDVLEIDAASNRGIDEIRELRETVRYLPARDRYKVFIIDEVHMLTTEAFNALLKTLEEPPPRSLFVMATTEAHKLPSTIQSRCQHFAFRLLDYGEIYSRLEQICVAEKITAVEGALSAIVQAAEGSVRDALSLLDEVIAACGEQLDVTHVRQLLGVVPTQFLSEMVEAIHTGESRRVLEQLNQLVSEGYELVHFCGEFTRYVRNLMVARSCGADSPLLQVSSDERETLRKLSARMTEEDIARFFQILLRTQAELRYSLQPRFHLELGLMKLVHARKLASLESLLAGVGGAHAGQAEQAGRPSLGQSAAGSPKSQASPPSQGPKGQALAPRSEKASAPPVAAPARPTAPLPPADGAPNVATGQDPRLAAIKALLFDQSKFLSSCLNPLAAWRFEDGEVHFIYPRDASWAVDLMKSREHQEKLTSVCKQVLGLPVRIYVTLQEGRTQTVTQRPSARERAGSDAMLAAFQRRFDCTVLDVKDLSRE
jgi:DNA polymerase III subunit gamma/tau